ncbi:MAG: efflux pump antibiotic resistance [Desulfovibrionaceae bacterium]|nr:MAG: efflux pump antibiotic resistance [Desulfovibrionaceae bacterium]
MDASERRSLEAQIAVGLASFLTPFLYGALSVAMPTIGRAFSFSAREMAMVMMVHLLFSTSCMLPVGRASDFIGRKGLFMAGSVLFSVSSLTAGLADSAGVLLFARALQGVGDALTFGVSGAILVTIVPPERTGRAIGFNLTFIFAGLALGPLAGGALTSWLSWRVIFYLSAAAGVAAFALIFRSYQEVRPQRSETVGYADTALFIPAMLGLILGLSVQPSWWGAALSAAAGLLLWRFVKFQEGHANPMVDVGYIRRNPAFALANVASVLGYAAAFSTSFLLSLFLQSVQGMAPHDAGYLLLVQPTVQALASPLAGRLSDMAHPARVSAAGLAVMGVGLLMLTGTGIDTTTLWMIGVQVVLGLGFSLFVSPNFNAIMSSVDPAHKGMASGFMSTMRGMGMCLSLSVTGLLLALVLGEAHTGQTGPEALPALKACFVIFGLSALAAAIVSWRAARQAR